MTTKRFGERFRGKRSFDGLFSDNIPLFADHVRPQLVFDLGKVQDAPNPNPNPRLSPRLSPEPNLGKVQYALSALVQATDPCIEALAVRAAPRPSQRLH